MEFMLLVFQGIYGFTFVVGLVWLIQKHSEWKHRNKLIDIMLREHFKGREDWANAVASGNINELDN